MPTLDNLRKNAKRWLKALRANDAEARARLLRAYPKAPGDPALRDVQHALAREHGSESWTALIASAAAAPRPARPDRGEAERVASFLEFACWDHHVHGRGGYARAEAAAMRILERHPEIARFSLYTAVVCGELDQVERILSEQPELAREKGSTRGWEPLLYLCYGRVPLAAARDNAVAIATALLDRGANPNAYYMAGDALYSALVGVAGEGEQDAPPHPDREALYRLLLERGAGPYDIQVLYNTHFHGDVLWWLELTYEHAMRKGLGADWADPDWPMLDMGGYGSGARFLFRIAISHDDERLARWLLSHGANPDAAPPRGRGQSRRTPYEDAVLAGATGIADLLAAYGAVRTSLVLDDEEKYVAACLRLDRSEVSTLLAAHPEYLRSPKALFAAVERDRVPAVEFVLDLGVPIDVADGQGQRALHVAAAHHALGAAALLVERGAAVDPQESNWGATPLGYASYARDTGMIDLLARRSRDVWHLASNGKVQRLREVLADRPELARRVTNGITPLWALPDDDATARDIVDLLLSSGADPSIRSKGGTTAADHARQRGMDEIAARLADAAKPASDASASRAGAGATLEKYEDLARALLVAYESGASDALDRVAAHYGRAVTQQDLRVIVRARVHAVRYSGGPVHYFDPADARDLIARDAGFGTWTAFADALAKGISAPSAPYVIDARESRIRTRRMLARDDWDDVIAIMQERRIAALDAGGQMTDDVLTRLSGLDHVVALNLEGSRHVTDDGLRHLARMPQLQRLNLSGCRVTDRGLEVLRQLRDLKTFELYHHTGITDEGIAHLAGCERLERVSLMGSATGDGAIRALAQKPALRYFQAGRRFTESGLTVLHEFPAFKTWQGGDLRYGLMDFDAGPTYLLLHPEAPFTKTGLAHLAGLDGLFALNLDNPAVRGADLGPLMDLPHLGWLGHDCDDAAMRQIAAMPRLRVLMCQDTEAGDDGFTALAGSSSIEYIWGRRCHSLTGRGFAALSRMPALRGLSVSCRNVDDEALATLPSFGALTEYMPMEVRDEGFRHVGRCSRLEALWCMYCRDTTDAATAHIAGLPALRTYYAGQTRITDRSLETLGGMLSLEEVTFWNCAGVTDAGLPFLARLPRLRKVVLDDLPNVTLAGVAAFPARVRVEFSG